MTASYFASSVPSPRVLESGEAVIGVWVGPTRVSNFTPSRWSAACQAWKSGSLVEVPSNSTLRSIRGGEAAEATEVLRGPMRARAQIRAPSRVARLEAPRHQEATWLGNGVEAVTG